MGHNLLFFAIHNDLCHLYASCQVAEVFLCSEIKFIPSPSPYQRPLWLMLSNDSARAESEDFSTAISSASLNLSHMM